MRHRKKKYSLNRTASHRSAMLSNMASSLIMHKRIFTTVPKAKALRIYIEPLLTKAKTDDTHSRRTVFSYLQNKAAVTELFRNISEKIKDRPGGYTRILKTGIRLGDNAKMCFIELVDYNENMLGDKKKAAPASKRTRRSRKKSAGTEQATASQTAEHKASKAVQDQQEHTQKKQSATKEEKATSEPQDSASKPGTEDKQAQKASTSSTEGAEKLDKPTPEESSEKEK